MTKEKKHYATLYDQGQGAMVGRERTTFFTASRLVVVTAGDEPIAWLGMIIALATFPPKAKSVLGPVSRIMAYSLTGMIIASQPSLL